MWIKAKARWGGLSEYLTRPAESIQDVEERHKVRLLAGMLLAMLLAALIIAPIWVLSSPEFPASLPISIGMITALVCALLFGRTRHYQLALYILIGLVPGIVITTILTSPGDIQNRLLALGFLIVGIMLASIVLNIRATVIMTLVCVGFTGAFFFVPGIPFDYVFSFLVYIAVTGALSVVATIIRSNYAQQLKENQQELDAFFNQSLSGCFFMEADEPFDWDNAPNRQELLRRVGNQMRVTRANDAILEQYGATQQQMIGMTFYDFFTHDMVQGLYILGQLLDAGKLRIETHERRLDGTPIRVEGDYVCFRDNRRRIIGLFGVQRDVTQRSRVEQALRQSEERYRALFEQAHDAIFIIDLQGKYLEANPRAAGMFGYTTEEMRHISISDISTEYEGSMSVLRRLLDGEEVPIYERHFRKKNGDILTAEVSSELVRDTEGHPLHFQCVLRDITERKELEKSLRESEARYRSVVNVLSEGIILHDINGAIIACNSASERILGLTKDQMMGRTSLDPRWHTIHEDGSIFPGEIHPAMVTLRTGESFKDVIMGVQHPGGELRWISVTTQPLVLPDVAQPYAVVVSFTDITERKQSDDALRMIEARQRALLSAIPDLMFRYDRDGNFLDYHATDASRLALPPHLFLGRNIRDVLPELAPLHMHYSERALATREEIIYEYTLPLDDEPIYFEARLVASGPDEVIAIVRDVTFTKQAQEQAFNLAVERARVKMLGQFIQTASHELRTPLAIVNTAVHLMARVDDPARRSRYAIQVEEQTLRLRQLVDMMLTMAQLDSGISFQKKLISLNNLLRQISATTQQKAKQTVEFEPDDTLPPLCVDADWLAQALNHLLDNAMRFTPEGGSIHIKTYRDDDKAVIAIQDTGIGISAAALPHIFERFWRQDEAHSTPGFGLGLSIAQKIIEMHDGRIEVQSTEGSGSIFRVLLLIAQS